MKRTLFSVKEVAQELGVSVQSIRRAYWRGEIPVYRISTMLRFDLERVQRIFLAKGLSRIVRPRGARSAAPAVDAHRRIAPVR
jgi:excisionase family DNA binding protein